VEVIGAGFLFHRIEQRRNGEWAPQNGYSCEGSGYDSRKTKTIRCGANSVSTHEQRAYAARRSSDKPQVRRKNAGAEDEGGAAQQRWRDKRNKAATTETADDVKAEEAAHLLTAFARAPFVWHKVGFVIQSL